MIKSKRMLPTCGFQCAFIVAASTALAVITLPFSGWDTLINRTPDILIVRCAKTPDPLNTRHNGVSTEIKDGLINS
jgi:hypothetical protein